MTLAAFLLYGLSGCKSTTVVDVYRESPSAAPAADESIVVLGRRHAMDHDTETDFVTCVGQTLNGSHGRLRVIPEKQFVDTMYPYFETSTAPMDVLNLNKLVKIPVVAAKFNEFKVRYFIWVDGATETVDKAGSISCAIGPGGGGCFGFAYWEDEANYEASIWDFKQLTLSGKISTETQGTSYLPAVVIPIPLLARVQSNACKSLAAQIESFLK
ncbi:MAG: hypothetical protein HYY48_10615 [Gammaproteobacteria bacterium]|nr:hypothetical protein [Gammaproteobacteria bacterium]